MIELRFAHKHEALVRRLAETTPGVVDYDGCKILMTSPLEGSVLKVAFHSEDARDRFERIAASCFAYPLQA